jgi:hypothetical protein
MVGELQPPMLNDVLLTPSDARVKTQGDLRASVAALQTQLDSRIRGDRSNSELWRKEIEDLKRGAARLSAEWQDARDSFTSLLTKSPLADSV